MRSNNSNNPTLSFIKEMRVLLFLSLLSLTISSSLRGPKAPLNPACDRFDDLPEECACRNGHGAHSLVIECLKPFNSTFLNDTIGIKMEVEPCDPAGSSVSIDVTDTAHGIDFPISSMRAGESKIIPIPGLSLAVPQLGHIGVDTVVDIAGNPDLLLLNIGLDACLAVRHRFICKFFGSVFTWCEISNRRPFCRCGITALS